MADQYIVQVTVTRMNPSELFTPGDRKDYAFSFRMGDEVPVSEMSDSAIFKQIVMTLAGMANPQPVASSESPAGASDGD